MSPFACPLLLWAIMQPPEQPPSIARLRFPPQWVAEDACRAGAAYNSAMWERWRESTYSFRPEATAHWERCMAESSRRQSAWNCLRMLPHEIPQEARDPDAFWRRWLGELESKLTPEEFAAGEMPHPIPFCYVAP